MSYDVADPLKRTIPQDAYRGPLRASVTSCTVHSTSLCTEIDSLYFVFAIEEIVLCFLFIACSRITTRLLSYLSIPVFTRLPSTVTQIKENYTVIVH